MTRLEEMNLEPFSNVSDQLIVESLVHTSDCRCINLINISRCYLFSQEIVNYHEIGRSISTLMANTTFHEVAYQAEERESLLQVSPYIIDATLVLIK